MEFIINNYMWIGVSGVIILMALVGFIAEKTNFIKKSKEDKKEKKANKALNKKEKKNKKNKDVEKEELTTEVVNESVVPIIEEPTNLASIESIVNEDINNVVETAVETPIEDVANSFNNDNNSIFPQDVDSSIMANIETNNDFQVDKVEEIVPAVEPLNNVVQNLEVFENPSIDKPIENDIFNLDNFAFDTPAEDEVVVEPTVEENIDFINVEPVAKDTFSFEAETDADNLNLENSDVVSENNENVESVPFEEIFENTTENSINDEFNLNNLTEEEIPDLSFTSKEIENVEPILNAAPLFDNVIGEERNVPLYSGNMTSQPFSPVGPISDTHSNVKEVEVLNLDEEETIN